MWVITHLLVLSVQLQPVFQSFTEVMGDRGIWLLSGTCKLQGQIELKFFVFAYVYACILRSLYSFSFLYEFLNISLTVVIHPHIASPAFYFIISSNTSCFIILFKFLYLRKHFFQTIKYHVLWLLLNKNITIPKYPTVFHSYIN